VILRRLALALAACSCSAATRAEAPLIAEASPAPVDLSQGSAPATPPTPAPKDISEGDPSAAREPSAGPPPAEPPIELAPDGTRGQPCPTQPPPGMACVPAGSFKRGDDDGPPHARPAATIWLQTFFIDLHEVTYAEYKACERARKCPRSGPAYSDFDRPRQPINGISWHDAVAYCAAQGKRLPTEAQWEKAARGPSGARFPWGDEPATCERAIIKDERGRGCGVKKLGDKPDTGRPWEVGSRPPGHYGLYDMSGNSWEWVADWYASSYAACGDACLGVDPRGPCAGAETCPGHRRKIVRGGSWYWDASYAAATWRRAHVPDNRPFHHFGVRCAATLADALALAPPG